MKRVIFALVVVLACAGCRGSSDDGIGDIEKTLTSIEADLDQP